MSNFKFEFQKDREILYQNMSRFIEDYINEQSKRSGPDYITHRNFICVLERLIKEFRK
jgi:hypothetical protein